MLLTSLYMYEYFIGISSVGFCQIRARNIGHTCQYLCRLLGQLMFSVTARTVPTNDVHFGFDRLIS